jgi:hypothetical protein
MSDGRVFTDYTSNCQHNKTLMKIYEKPTNNEFRQFLQSNGDVVMKDFDAECKGKCKRNNISL